MKYCKKCGWIMQYKPRSHQEHIKEIIGKQNKRGFWECPKCGLVISENKKKRGK